MYSVVVLLPLAQECLLCEVMDRSLPIGDHSQDVWWIGSAAGIGFRFLRCLPGPSEHTFRL